ncbi:MAG: hypothetical protein NDI95_16280, partial [Acidovorax soli]|nr:hypothetical protein [Acidovorax soli]
MPNKSHVIQWCAVQMAMACPDGMGASLPLRLALRPAKCQIADPVVNIEMETIMERTIIAVDIAKKVFQL